MLDIQEYIEQRLDPQIQCYNQKSVKNKKWYNLTQIIEITCASLIPLLSPYANCLCISIFVGVLGAAIALTESLSKLYHFHENRIQYSITAELLKREKHLFLTKSHPYLLTEETLDNIFIKNIEDIMSSENKSWNQLSTQESLKKTP